MYETRTGKRPVLFHGDIFEAAAATRGAKLQFVHISNINISIGSGGESSLGISSLGRVTVKSVG